MPRSVMIAAILFTVNFSISRARDCFPIQTGNTWKFSFEEYNGHGSGGTTWKGHISWTILSQTMIDSGKGKSIVDVAQKSELMAKSYWYFDLVDNYDSIFDPPRITLDTITLIDSSNICLDTENNRILIHDPQGPVSDRYCVIDTTIKINENDLSCVIPIDTPCDLSSDHNLEHVKHSEFNFFYQAESKGPVKYIFDSRGTVRRKTGIYHRIEWVLLELAQQRAVKRKYYKKQYSSERTYYTITGIKLGSSAHKYSGVCIERVNNVHPAFQKIVLLHSR